MSYKFEKLIIWQNAMIFGEDILKLLKGYPKTERYNLTSQINRVVNSIALNIFDGAIEQSKSEFRKFLGYAIRSLAEVETFLHKAIRKNYITQEQFHCLYANSFELMNRTLDLKHN